MLDALEYTIPFGAVIRKEERYLERAELFCIYDLAFKVDGEVSATCLKIIEEMCEKELIRDMDPARLCVYEVLMGELASYLGDNGFYDKSLNLSEKLLKECMLHRRAIVLVDNLYNKVWNYQNQINSIQMKENNNVISNVIRKCIFLSEFNRADNWITFLQQKLKNL